MRSNYFALQFVKYYNKLLHCKYVSQIYYFLPLLHMFVMVLKVRRNFDYGSSSGASAVYWMISDCHNWANARSLCQSASGDLAWFPTLEDRAYLMSRFVNE